MDVNIHCGKIPVDGENAASLPVDEHVAQHSPLKVTLKSLWVVWGDHRPHDMCNVTLHHQPDAAQGFAGVREVNNNDLLLALLYAACGAISVPVDPPRHSTQSSSVITRPGLFSVGPVARQHPKIFGKAPKEHPPTRGEDRSCRLP